MSNQLEERMQKETELVEKEMGKKISELSWGEYIKTLNELTNKGNIFPPCIPSQVALNFLTRYLLGEDWYVIDPICNAQVNAIIVDEILRKYSKRFRKELKKHKREQARKKKGFKYCLK